LVYDDTTAPFFDALARACRRGVTVRVLSDHIAQFSYPNRKKTVEVLREMGAQYQPMLPLQPLKGTGGGRTCATTASWWSSTAGSGTPAR
jgi:cardiolipin synthase A/B